MVVFQFVIASSSERALGEEYLNGIPRGGKSLGYCVLLHSLDGDMAERWVLGYLGDSGQHIPVSIYLFILSLAFFHHGACLLVMPGAL